MPCQPSARANHTLLRSCCDDTGCGCETRSSFFAQRFCPCNEAEIDQPARQVTVCDLLAPLGGRTFTQAAFYTALALALAPRCGSIDVSVRADAIVVANVVDGVVTTTGATLADGSYTLTVIGADSCDPLSAIVVTIQA